MNKGLFYSRLGLVIFALAVLLPNYFAWAMPNCAAVHNDFKSVNKSVSNRDTELQTQKLHQHLQKSFQNRFSTSGFFSPESFQLAVEKGTELDPNLYKSALDILRHERLQVATRLPFDIREQIMEKGFLNFHQARSSQGSSFSRSEIEASYANLNIEQYKSLTDEVKPKYAAIYPEDNSGLSGPKSLDSYAGTDKYYFKLDRIRQRMTVTPGDSLNRFVYWNGHPQESKSPESWDQMFIPWSERSILVPVLAEGLKVNRLGLPDIAPVRKWSRPDEYGNQFDIVGKDNLSEFKMKWQPNMDYVEAQIWGALTLNDVAIFEYTKWKPTGQFLKELQKRGIEIRDGRKKRENL